MALDDSHDLLGFTAPVEEIYAPPTCEPGRVVDLSGTASRPMNGVGGSSSSTSRPLERGPRSIEGGREGLSLTLLSPAHLMRELGSRPVTDVVIDNSRELLKLPAMMLRVYQHAAKQYLRPWGEFARLNPARVFQDLRNAAGQGQLQIHLQRNVALNVRTFCPNYVFVFMATLFMFLCTSPMLLGMLGMVGGGWTYAIQSEGFRNRPWNLQLGAVQVPLGSNMKMLILSLPTLLFLHWVMGPLLWSAALYSSGLNIAHAALHDRRGGGGDDGEGDGWANASEEGLP